MDPYCKSEEFKETLLRRLPGHDPVLLFPRGQDHNIKSSCPPATPLNSHLEKKKKKMLEIFSGALALAQRFATFMGQNFKLWSVLFAHFYRLLCIQIVLVERRNVMQPNHPNLIHRMAKTSWCHFLWSSVWCVSNVHVVMAAGKLILVFLT